jgi:hypothetical protein
MTNIKLKVQYSIKKTQNIRVGLIPITRYVNALQKWQHKPRLNYSNGCFQSKDVTQFAAVVGDDFNFIDASIFAFEWCYEWRSFDLSLSKMINLRVSCNVRGANSVEICHLHFLQPNNLSCLPETKVMWG